MKWVQTILVGVLIWIPTQAVHAQSGPGPIPAPGQAASQQTAPGQAGSQQTAPGQAASGQTNPQTPALAAAPLPAGYQAAIDRAILEFNLRNYAEARASFQAAHDLLPNARSLRGLGMAEFELKNYGTCIDYLQRALRSKTRPLSESLRAKAQTLLATAESYVAGLRLHLLPAGAQVLIDGELVSLGTSGRIVIKTGDHTLDVRAAGYASERRSLSVTSGREESLRIELLSLALPTHANVDSPAVYERWWFWTAAGAVVAGSIITALALSGGDEYTPPTTLSGGVQVMALEGR